MSDENEWELSKENVQPIRQGRHLSNLSAGLQLSEDQLAQLRKEKQQFEAELRTYSGDDPLEVWHRYLVWTEQNCVKGGKENNLEKLLENYLRQFSEEIRYHNDPRYVSAWIRYVNMCKKPADLFSYMYDQKIGNELCCFYESWAWVLEQMGNTKQANMIYQEGIKRKAEPVDILERKYSNFQMRVARGLAGKVMDDAPEESLEQRAALGQLKTTGKKNTVPVDRINATKPNSRGLGLQPVKPAQVGQKFTVFNDENQEPVLPGQKGDWSDVPTRAVINKENEKKAGVWTKAKVPCKAVAPPSTPSFSLYVEENADQPMTTPRKLPEVGNQVLSARKPSKPVDNVENFKHEQSNPNQKPMYAKDKVYCGAEEYSFEEIRAALWFDKKKREEKKRRMEEEQKLIDEQREQLKRNQLLLQQEAEQFRLTQQSLQEERQVFLEQCRSEMQRQQEEFKREREIMIQRQKEILEKEIEERMTAGLLTSMENRENVSSKQFDKDVQSRSVNESQAVTKSPQKSSIQNNPSLSILQNENENACKSSLVENCSQMSLSHGVQQNNSALVKPSKTGSSQLSFSNIKRNDVENVTPNNRSFGLNNSGGRLTNSNSGGRKSFSGPSPTVNTKQAMQLVTGMFNASLAIEANLGWDDDEDDMVTAPPQAVQPVASNVPFTVFNDEEMDVGQASNKENDENRFSKSMEFVGQRKKGLSRGGSQHLSKDNFENMEYEGKMESIESQARDDFTICPIGTNQSFAAAARIASTPFNRDKPPDPLNDMSRNNSIEPSDAKRSLQIYTSSQSCFHSSGPEEESQNLSPIMEGSNEEGSDHHGQSNGLSMSHTQKSHHHAMETESVLAAPKYEDLNQSSHVIDTTKYIPSPSVRLQLESRNPFDEKDIEKHLKSLSKPLISRSNYVQIDERMHDIRLDDMINLGDDTYIAQKIIGKGGNAKVYMVSIFDLGCCDDRQENMALKVQSPACPWEFYICSEIHDRLTELNSVVDVRPAMMCARKGYFFNNCSCILTDYHAQGTLLDFVNDKFMKTNASVGEPMAMYITIEMLYMIENLHKCQIIHGDVKPDNFLFIGISKLKDSTDPKTVFGGSNRCVQLIDFGQSIDMSKYPKGTTFRAKVKTSGFQCIEMQTDRPWTYQTDLFGLVGTVHVLLFKKYMQIYQSQGEWKITSSFMRGWNVPLWKKLFHSCLNIPSCDQIPDISAIRREFEEYFVNNLLDKYNTTQSAIVWQFVK